MSSILPLNPLDIEHVLTRVLEHLDPAWLLTCRLINRSWCTGVTKLLNQQGWSVYLSGERVGEYLQLLKAVTAAVAEVQDPPPAPYGLDLTIAVDLASPSSTNAVLEIAVGLKNTRSIKRGAEITGMEVTLSPSPLGVTGGIGPSLDRLLVLTAPSLHRLQFEFLHSEDLSNRPNANAPPFWSGDLRLPALSSMRVLYRSWESINSAATLQLASLASSEACPALISISASPAPDSTITPRVGTEALLEFVSASRKRKLETMEFNVGQLARVWGLLHGPPQSFHFEQLHTLRLTTCSIGSLPDGSRFIEFLSSHCSALKVLELTDPIVLEEVQVQDWPGDGDRAIPPQVTTLGYHLRVPHPIRTQQVLPMWERVEPRLIAILKTMIRFPELTTFKTNFEAIGALARLFQNLRAQGEPQEWQMLHVVRLELNVSHASVYAPSHGGAEQELREAITSLLRTLFPNLQELVIWLGGDRVVWKVTTDLGYVLRIFLEVPGLRAVEINNYYGAWTLGEPHMSGSHDLRAGCTTLESLTVRGATRSFCRTHIDTSAYTSHRLDFSGLLAAISPYPETLQVQIEAQLLLPPRATNSGERNSLWRRQEAAQASYDELQEQILEMRNPFVKLI